MSKKYKHFPTKIKKHKPQKTHTHTKTKGNASRPLGFDFLADLLLSGVIFQLPRETLLRLVKANFGRLHKNFRPTFCLISILVLLCSTAQQTFTCLSYHLPVIEVVLVSLLLTLKIFYMIMFLLFALST